MLSGVGVVGVRGRVALVLSGSGLGRALIYLDLHGFTGVCVSWRTVGLCRWEGGEFLQAVLGRMGGAFEVVVQQRVWESEVGWL